MGAGAKAQEDPMRLSTARFLRVVFLATAPLALLAVQAQAQSNPPMPSFTFTPEAPVAGVPVFFTNTTPGPLTNLTWIFGDPISGTDNHSFLPDPSHVFAQPGTYSVLLTVANASASASVSRTITVAAGSGGGGGGGGTCVASATQLCVNNNRFAVTSTWTDADGNTGSGNAVLLTADSGYFWFFDPTNVELVTKVLNGCAITDAYWVFASGLTNVAVNLLVVDTQTGAQYTFDNPQGVAFPPDQATKAFPASCP
jgi:PKD repeat protein